MRFVNLKLVNFFSWFTGNFLLKIFFFSKKMTTWVYFHGGPPFGIKYANEVTQELRKINPDFYIYFYIELEPAIEFKKFK